MTLRGATPIQHIKVSLFFREAAALSDIFNRRKGLPKIHSAMQTHAVCLGLGICIFQLSGMNAQSCKKKKK